MTPTITNGKGNITHSESLSALSPELPLLATRAAIELDNILLQKDSSLENVRLLAEQLNGSTQGQGTVCQFTADLPTVDVISRALIASDCKVKTIADAAMEAWRMASELNAVGEGEEEAARLKRLRTFCVELARSASIFRSMFEEAQPSSSQWS